MQTEKVSVSLPKPLLDEARKYANGNLSKFMAEAVQMALKNRYLGDYLDELEEEYGPLTEDEIAEGRAWLTD